MEVDLRYLSKRYHQVGAVRDLSLTIRDGEFLVLLGPSGCGKTTTLRMIAGLTPPDSGDIIFGGRRVNTVHPSKRDIAMVFQDYALYPHKTVYENIAFTLRVRRVPRVQIQEKVEGVAQLMAIHHLLHRKPRDLSGGERQRVAVGRAIVRDPRLFLMDEPLSNLDAKLRDQMHVELKALQRRLRVTTVYVTHDQSEAMLLADRIAVMNDGRVLQVGTPQEIYRHPVNLFTAAFVGSPRINLLRGRLRGGVAPEFVLDGPAAWRFSLPQVLGDLATGSERAVVLGFRPESGRLLAGWEDERALQVSLDFTEQLGPDNLLVTRLRQDSGMPRDDQRIILRVSAQHGPSPDRLALWLDAEDVYIFDQATEEALYCRGRSRQEMESPHPGEGTRA